MAGFYETKTFTRAEWDELQKGVENQLRTTYEQYLERVGLKSEAEAVAKRKEEDAAGKKFGSQDVPLGVFGTATRADRKISDAEEAALQAAQASNDAQAAKQIAALTGGRITGNEPVYRYGTPEFNAYWAQQLALAKQTGKQPQAPDAYLDAQAFAARYIAYDRLGSNQATSLLWDDVNKRYYREPSPFYDPKIATPTVGMGNEWQALQQRLFAAPAGPQRDAAQYDLDVFFGRQIGYAPGATIRDLRAFPGGVIPGLQPNAPIKTRISAAPDGNGNFVINYSDGSKQVTDKNGVITTTSSDGKIIPNDTAVDAFGNAEGWMLGDGTGGDGTGGGGTGGVGGTSGTGTSGNNATTNLDVLKASLRGLGFTSGIINASASFLSSLLRDGLDADNATEIFLNSQEYTLKNGKKMTSPFYTEYGYLNEGLTVPKDAATIFNTVEGFKGVVDKYKLSSKYMTPDSLKLYFKNDVTVADLSERAGAAQLRAVESDPFQVDSLMKLGYIGSPADLTDFYLDNKIGKEQLELNRQTGVFTAEALRRAKSGISTSADQIKGFKQLTATLAAKGYSEAQISQLAGTGFENIAQTLQPTTQLAQIYEKAGGTVQSNTALTENIQSNLLQEEFMGTASERRKRLSEQNIRAFQGQAGTTTGSLRTSSTAGLL